MENTKWFPRTPDVKFQLSAINKNTGLKFHGIAILKLIDHINNKKNRIGGSNMEHILIMFNSLHEKLARSHKGRGTQKRLLTV